MADDKKFDSIFSGVNDAINKNKRRTPRVENPGIVQNVGSGLINRENNVEHVQQQFLDWQVNKIAQDLYARTIYYDTDRISTYQDFRAMDQSPEIAAALNIIRDECLEANTIIPLLNGEKVTIEELYNRGANDFYVYSYNSDDDKVESALCERVVYKGEQDVYKVTFDDDSYIMATSEHMWLIKGENKYITTSKLLKGQSIEPFYTRISNNEDRINGYEMVLENGKWEYTHRIVKRDFWPDKKGVVHHKDIHKLNNDPSNLEVLGWFEHQELHHKLNSERWKNDKVYSEKMKKIFSETNSINGPYWSDDKWRNKRVSEMSKRGREKYSSFTSEKLKEKFGYKNWSEFVSKFNSKEIILNRIKKKVLTDGLTNLSEICKKERLDRKKIEGLISRSKFKTWTNYLSSINHSIKSIEFVGKKKTYDLVNVGKYHNFAVLTSNGTGVFTHNCITRGEKGKILDIFSENERVKTVLDDLFYNRLDIDFALKLWIRDLLKYGDFFLHLHVDKEEGIYDVIALPVDEIHREEGYEGRTDNVRFRWETTGDYFEDWQVAHFRLLEDVQKLPYGRSMLDPARKLWKQLQLAEDSMLVYRITRAPERRVFYIDVGNLEHADVGQFIQQFQMQLKKQPIVDQKTGNINQKYNPMNVTEDYFIPMRADKSSRIETLPGASNLGDIQDIEYLQNKLFASIQVPKNYLNYGESLPGGSTLSQKDLRFARTINTIQQSVLAELKRVANIHLYFNGFKDEIDNFTLTLTNPSTQQELLKLETMKARLEVFKEMFSAEATSPVSYVWAMENILGFSKSDIKLILKQKKVEKKIFAEIDSSVEMYKKIGLFKDLDDKYEIEGAEEMMKAKEGGGEEGGGDLGGGSFGGDLGGADMGGAEELDMGEGGGEEDGGEEVPMAENKFRKAQNLSDRYIGNMLNELLGPDEDSNKKKSTTEDNALIKRSKSINFESQRLIDSMSGNLQSKRKTVIQEKIENPFIDGSERLGDDNEIIVNDIERFLRNRKNNNDD